MKPGNQQSKRVNILGVGVNTLNMRQTLDIIRDWIDTQQPQYVCVTPAHAIMSCINNIGLRTIYNCSGLTTPDGMSIVWLLWWYGYKDVERVYGPDLLLAACKQFLREDCRHYFYGGAPCVAELLAKKLRLRFPGLKVVGTASPPFRQLTLEEEQIYVDKIRNANPDIVWVGIGSPRQEKWMHEVLDVLNGPVLVGVGAAFDFLSGNKPQASTWIQRIGMEWLFRLLNEPRRLWRRYIQYPKFVWLVLLQRLGITHYPME
jgi:N-acetylglucosaminyldiphosphoundecaprenol N-acetyl-beta-D-mannosaminyltransferase